MYLSEMPRRVRQAPPVIFGLIAVAFMSTACTEDRSEVVLAQTEPVTLASGDRHTYEITTRAGQHVSGSVNQGSVDVVVTVTGPDGVRIGEFDVSARGAEQVRFEAAAAGIHEIAVSPFEGGAGEYYVRVFRQEPLAKTPEGKIDQLMSAYGEDTPGGVVAVVRGGNMVFSESYGLANVEYQVPNTAATPYHVASVSKQFTAMAIVMLSQRGLLGLDDDVRRHLPELPDFGHTITLRHLLNHTSGLRDHWNLWAMSGGRMDDVIRQQDLLRLVHRQRNLNFEPGAEYLYCNTGFMLLSEIVTAVSEQPFGDWMADNVFEPLGMSSTQIYDDHERVVPGRAYSYRNSDDGLAKAVLSYANSGATSLFTTTEDLARWLANFKSGTVGGMAAIELLQVQGILNDGETIDYALGLGITEQNGLRRLSHGGADAGFRTWLGYYPEIDAGVVVLGNETGFRAGAIGTAVAEAFFSEHMSFADDAAAEDVPDSSDNARTPADIGAAVAGRFAIEGGGYIEFAYADGALSAEVEGQPAYAMLPVEDYEFRVDGPGDEVVVRFDAAADGTVDTATLLQNGEIPLRRAARWQPGAEELAAYAGRYYSDELETFYRVSPEADALIISHVRHGDFSLVPQEKDVFSSSEWFIGTVSFDSDPDERTAAMRMSNGRVRNLLFERVE